MEGLEKKPVEGGDGREEKGAEGEWDEPRDEEPPPLLEDGAAVADWAKRSMLRKSDNSAALGLFVANGDGWSRLSTSMTLLFENSCSASMWISMSASVSKGVSWSSLSASMSRWGDERWMVAVDGRVLAERSGGCQKVARSAWPQAELT